VFKPPHQVRPAWRRSSTGRSATWRAGAGSPARPWAPPRQGDARGPCLAGQATVSSVVDAFFSTISETVAKGGKVTIPGWLAAERSETAARTGRNPQTGAEISIPAGHRVKLTAGSKLKAAVK
jgi:DNA-binding protein HU-beta